jgi:hypothetical protein
MSKKIALIVLAALILTSAHLAEAGQAKVYRQLKGGFICPSILSRAWAMVAVANLAPLGNTLPKISGAERRPGC